MNFIFEQIRAGGDRNFAYLIGDRAAGLAAVVDPASEPERSLERARVQGLTITHILNTHGHLDHTEGNLELKRATGAKIHAGAGSPARPDQILEDGDVINVGAFGLKVLHVPGHTPDHLLFHLEEQRIAITGDLLFVGKIGGTGNDRDARTEHESLGRLLRELPDDTTIWPGHDYGCRPSSTLALEKACNPFLLKDLPSFLQLKRDWAVFKAENGLA
ncbi:MAG: MBL fold metallo-hydrolase [Planctomycetota bacterium]